MESFVKKRKNVKSHQKTKGNNMEIVFWNVDTQYDFMRGDGALAILEAITIDESEGEFT